MSSFNSPIAPRHVRCLLDTERIDMVVIDEIHFTKQRTQENISQRKQALVQAMVVNAGEDNPDVCVLGMSATPVINNLHEGRSMVELVPAVAHEELDDRPTVAELHGPPSTPRPLGIRWMPEYTFQCDDKHVEVDCRCVPRRILRLGKREQPASLWRRTSHAPVCP